MSWDTKIKEESHNFNFFYQQGCRRIVYPTPFICKSLFAFFIYSSLKHFFMYSVWLVTLTMEDNLLRRWVFIFVLHDVRCPRQNKFVDCSMLSVCFFISGFLIQKRKNFIFSLNNFFISMQVCPSNRSEIYFCHTSFTH